jgi:aromatic ring hydroxylase
MSAMSSKNSELKSPFFVQNKDKAVCLVRTEDQFSKSVANIKRHYDARHEEKYDVFQGQVRTDKSKSLQRALSDQQNIFKS